MTDPLSDLLIELSSTPTATRWSERRRGARATTAAAGLRPRAASCSRRLMSDTAAATALTSKSLSHTQLYRNPSNSSEVDSSSFHHVRQRSHQQLQPVRQHSTVKLNIARNVCCQYRAPINFLVQCSFANAMQRSMAMYLGLTYKLLLREQYAAIVVAC